MGGFYGQPVSWNANICTKIVGSFLRQYLITNGVISTRSTSNSSTTFRFRDATPVVSANGTMNGIAWVADITAHQTGCPAVLFAYDACNILAGFLRNGERSGTATKRKTD